MGSIVGIIIVIWIVVAVFGSKNQKKNQNPGPAQTMQQKAQGNSQNTGGKRPQQTGRENGRLPGQQDFKDREREQEKGLTAEERQRELKTRLAKKYQKVEKSDILNRAKASVEEDFGPEEEEVRPLTSYHEAGAAGKMREAGAAGIQSSVQQQEAAAKRSNIQQQGAMAGDENSLKYVYGDDMSSDMMKEIENLMIMGPNTEIAFERDFVSEGLDMLNQIQV